MFEGIVSDFKTKNRSQAYTQHIELCEQDALDRFIASIEKYRGHALTSDERKTVEREVREEDAKRRLPEHTYEDWHDPSEQASQSVDSELRRLKRTNFDAYVREKVLLSLGPVVNSPEEQAEHETREPEAADLDTLSSSDSENSDTSQESGDEGGESDAEDAEEDGDIETGSIKQKLRDWRQGKFPATKQKFGRSWARDRFLVMQQGLEPDVRHVARIQSVRRAHALQLSSLLHILVLQRRWDDAYRVFAVLIRFRRLDARLIWPLAAEILTEQLQTANGGAKRRKLGQFYEWLKLATAIPVRRPQTSGKEQVFRLASRNHAPMLMQNYLWMLLKDKQYAKVRETLSELLLQPPFSIDGTYYYILAACGLMENVHLAALFLDWENVAQKDDLTLEIGDLADEDWSSIDKLRKRFSSNVTEINEALSMAESHGFVVPRGEVEVTIDLLQRVFDKELKAADVEAECLRLMTSDTFEDLSGSDNHTTLLLWNGETLSHGIPNFISEEQYRRQVLEEKSAPKRVKTPAVVGESSDSELEEISFRRTKRARTPRMAVGKSTMAVPEGVVTATRPLTPAKSTTLNGSASVHVSFTETLANGANEKTQPAKLPANSVHEEESAHLTAQNESRSSLSDSGARKSDSPSERQPFFADVSGSFHQETPSVTASQEATSSGSADFVENHESFARTPSDRRIGRFQSATGASDTEYTSKSDAEAETIPSPKFFKRALRTPDVAMKKESSEEASGSSNTDIKEESSDGSFDSSSDEIKEESMDELSDASSPNQMSQLNLSPRNSQNADWLSQDESVAKSAPLNAINSSQVMRIGNFLDDSDSPSAAEESTNRMNFA